MIHLFNNRSIKVIFRGLLSYLPGLLRILKKGKGRKGTGGTNSARYCYAVWFRHLLHLNELGIKNHPEVIAEIGPGDSLGVGLAALITGATTYYAFDLIEHTNIKANLSIFDELVELFLNRAIIPGKEEFPLLKPKIIINRFPEREYDWNFLLSPERLAKIRNAVCCNENDSFKIIYKVPWDREYVILPNSVDLIFSQAVMEHILAIDEAYKKMFLWLRVGGFISHEIDYSAHETHKIWNGHWAYSNLIWNIIMHGRSYKINRYPHSLQRQAIIKAGFKIFKELKTNIDVSTSKNAINKHITNLDFEDYVIRSAFIQAQKMAV